MDPSLDIVQLATDMTARVSYPQRLFNHAIDCGTISGRHRVFSGSRFSGGAHAADAAARRGAMGECALLESRLGGMLTRARGSVYVSIGR